METMETTASVGPDQERVWQRLHDSLVRWLRTRVRCLATASDLAAETVSRAWRRFFFDSLPGAPPVVWDTLWAWCVAVARHLTIDLARRRTAARLVDGVDVGMIAALAGHDARSRDIEPLVVMVRPRLGAADRATLDLLLAGVESNLAIAGIRGVTLRSVERSRRRLRDLGAAMWQECRLRRCRTYPLTASSHASMAESLLKEREAPHVQRRSESAFRHPFPLRAVDPTP